MDADARFRAKLDARAKGATPVFTAEPALPQGDDQAAIDERFRAKLERHGRPKAKAEGKAAVPASEPEPVAAPATGDAPKVVDPAADAGKSDPKAKAEGKGEPQRR